jgi:hypothetical protein
MKRASLWMIVSALLVALGFAQSPAPSTKTAQTDIKGCLGGSAADYTVLEDNTGRTFKITTSSVDLKPHLGHGVTLIGHKASEASSAAPDNNFAVTEVNIISEQCAAAATASTAASAVTAGTPSGTASIPAPATTAPAATADTVAETAVAPVVASAAVTAVATTAPAATVSMPAATVVQAAAPTTQTASRLAHSRSQTTAPAADTKPDVTVSSPAETVNTPAVAATAPAATDRTSAETVSTRVEVAPEPTAPARGGSVWLLVAFAVVVIVLGTMSPLISRWRKRRLLERTDAPNLSLTPDGISEPAKTEHPAPVKAA